MNFHSTTFFFNSSLVHAEIFEAQDRSCASFSLFRLLLWPCQPANEIEISKWSFSSLTGQLLNRLVHVLLWLKKSAAFSCFSKVPKGIKPGFNSLLKVISIFHFKRFAGYAHLTEPGRLFHKHVFPRFFPCHNLETQ